MNKVDLSLQPFMEALVNVDVPGGSVSGVLRRAERSRHQGIGCLLLETREGWLLVKAWVAIKRRV